MSRFFNFKELSVKKVMHLLKRYNEIQPYVCTCTANKIQYLQYRHLYTFKISTFYLLLYIFDDLVLATLPSSVFELRVRSHDIIFSINGIHPSENF